MRWLALLLLAWALDLALSWLRVDLWLRHLTPPAAAEPEAAAAPRLWLTGRRAVALPAWAAVPGWLGLTLILRPHLGGPAAALAALAALLPALLLPVLFLRFALRKQFPHLTRRLPGWWER